MPISEGFASRLARAWRASWSRVSSMVRSNEMDICFQLLETTAGSAPISFARQSGPKSWINRVRHLAFRPLLRALLAHNIAFVILHGVLSAMHGCRNGRAKQKAGHMARLLNSIRSSGSFALLDGFQRVRNALQRIGVVGLGAALRLRLHLHLRTAAHGCDKL